MNWPVTGGTAAAGPFVPLTAGASAGTTGRNAYCQDGIDNGNGIICRGGYVMTSGSPSSLPFTTYTADIRDGLSNTFSVGEALPQYCPWSIWYWFEGTSATCGIPMNYKSSMKPNSVLTNWQQNCSFMSRHPGGANFGLCDGSGTFVNENMAPAIYQGMATIDGREQVMLPP